MEAVAVSTSIVPPVVPIEQIAVAEIDKHTPRFFVQFGWDELRVDTPAIHNQILPRGIIVPCTSFKQPSNRFEIREADRIPGSDKADRDGKIIYASYWKHAKFESERLIENEDRADDSHKTGLREVTSLRGKPDVWHRCKVNVLFYGDLTALPESNLEMIAHLETRLQHLKDNPPEHISPADLPVIYAVGEELVAAAKYNHELQVRRLEFFHSCMKLQPKEPEHRRAYDAPAEEMLIRTGMKRIHALDQSMSTALELLAENAENSSSGSEDLKELIAVMKQQAENQQKMIDTLLAERSETKIQTKKERN